MEPTRPGQFKQPPAVAPTVPAFLRWLSPPDPERRVSKPEGAGGTGTGGDSGSDYEISCITAEYDAPAWIAEWRRMLRDSQSTEKIYQTPEFFRFLAETGDIGSGDFDLFAIRRKSDGEVVGIVPVRTGSEALEFSLGRRPLCAPELPVIRLLGSVPILAAESGLMAYLLAYLFDRFPKHKAISMPSFPALLCGDGGPEPGPAFHSYVINGWRDCHTMPLPDNFDLYLQKFSTKKRYNLSRQIRLLEKEAGKVQVRRIERHADVAAMMQALNGILSAHELASVMSETKFERLAANCLLLCYVVTCGDVPVAVVLGTRACDVWHVHNIFCERKYLHLSVGTSAVHLALEDVMNNFEFTEADFGYGSPNQEFNSSHVLKKRGHVLLCRSRSRLSLLFGVHRIYDCTRTVLVKRLKSFRKKIGQRYGALKKP